MSWVNDALTEFGLRMGVPSFRLGEHGVAQLELEGGGLVAIEPASGVADEVLVYLARPLGFDGAAVLRAALARAHYASARPEHVSVAVRGSGRDALLVVLVRVPERDLTPQALAMKVEFLMRWFEELRNG